MSTLILIGATFDADIMIPGLGLQGQVPDKKSGGWVGASQGYSLRVVGDRLEVWAPPGTAQSTAGKAELDANGIDPSAAVAMVSIPLSRCILRYAGAADARELGTEAPSEAMKRPPEPKPAPPIAKQPVSATPVKQPPKAAAPTPRGPTPTPRRPPGARAPSKETGIVRDLSDEEAEAIGSSKRGVPLAIERGAGSVEE